MPRYQQKWWKTIFSHKEPAAKIDVLKDVQAVLQSLQDIPDDIKILRDNLQKLEELEKERQVAHADVIPINLEAQAELLDKILERYQFFQDDVDINGIRLQEIAREFLKHAEKAGLKDLVKEKKDNLKWKGPG